MHGLFTPRRLTIFVTIASLSWIVVLLPVAAAGNENAPAAAAVETHESRSGDPPPPPTPDRLEFLHPPLNCMKRFTRVKRFPIVGWCFHGKGEGYTDHYVEVAKGAGFNVLIDSHHLLKAAARVGNVQVIPVAMRWSLGRVQRDIFSEYGAHPHMVALLLDDNNPKIYDNSVKVSRWMKEKYPDIIPYISENPDPKTQSATPMRILSTQNYSVKNFGHGNYARQAYCSGMGRDRIAANQLYMTFWPLWVTPCSTSEMRYQNNVALAYGAQGVVCFAYTPTRPNWNEGKWNYVDAIPINKKIADTFGPRVWGMRCPWVYHDSRAPVTDTVAGPGKFVERLDSPMLVSPLCKEKDFYGGKPGERKKTYVMVVDKRTAKSNRDNPPMKTVHVQFGPRISFVERLGPVHFTKEGVEECAPGTIRCIEPAWTVPLEFRGGDAAILGVDPPDLAGLLGEAVDDYMAIVERGRELRQRLREAAKHPDDAADAADARADAADARANIAELYGHLKTEAQQLAKKWATSGAEDFAVRQRAELTKLLSARVLGLEQEVKRAN